MSISLTISISLYFWLKCFFCLMWTSMYLLLGELCQFLCFLRKHSFKIQPFQTALTLSSTRADAWLELYWMPLRGFHPFCASLPRPLLSWCICPQWGQLTGLPSLLFSVTSSECYQNMLTPANSLCPQVTSMANLGGMCKGGCSSASF